MTAPQSLISDLRALADSHRKLADAAYADPNRRSEYMLHCGYRDAYDHAISLVARQLPKIESAAFYRGAAEADPEAA